MRKTSTYLGLLILANFFSYAAFAGNDKIKTPVRASYSNHVFHQYTLVLEGVNRDELKAFLASNNIPSMIYYPVPGHKQKMFSQFKVDSLEMPVTDWLTERVISLPIHTEMENEQLTFISSKVLEYINQ